MEAMQEDTKKEVGGACESDQAVEIAKETTNEALDSENKHKANTLPEGSGEDKVAEHPQAEPMTETAEPGGATETQPPKPAQPTQLSVRAYLESTVVPILMHGLQKLVNERPEDPIQWLANYLIENNPKKQKEVAQE